MQAIELSAEIDKNRQIHLQLPNTVSAHKARVIVVYEDEQASIDKKPRTFGLHKGMIEMSDDFDEPLPDILWLGNEA
jgi:hypothetical protein